MIESVDRTRSPFRSFAGPAALVAFCVLALFSVGALARRDARIRHQAQTQRAFMDEVRRRGGRVVAGPLISSGVKEAVIAVDLSGRQVDRRLIGRLKEFPSLERLNLENTRLTREDFRVLGELTNVRSLSLGGSNLLDVDLQHGFSQIRMMSVRNTRISDAALVRLFESRNLTSLDISATEISARGLAAIGRARSLKTLDLDEDCVTQDSVQAIREARSIELLRIHIKRGLGRRTMELVESIADSASIQALNTSDEILWTAGTAWDDTVAGVVERVAEEVELDDGEMSRLIAAIGAREMFRRATPASSGVRPRAAPEGMPVDSVEALIGELHRSQNLTAEVLQFSRSRMSNADISILLESLGETDRSPEPWIPHQYGTYILVRAGMDHPETEAKLARWLCHDNAGLRAATVRGFGDGGAVPEPWIPGVKAVEFVMPRLIQLANDPEPSVRYSVAEVLGDLVGHFPDRAATIMSMLIALVERDSPGPVNRSIRRVVEVRPEVARAFVPQLRAIMRERLQGDTPLPKRRELGTRADAVSILYALCDIASTEPAMANEIAREVLEAMRARKAYGNCLLPLVRPENTAANRVIVRGLLDLAGRETVRSDQRAHATLAEVARIIRDYRVAAESERETSRFAPSTSRD